MALRQSAPEDSHYYEHAYEHAGATHSPTEVGFYSRYGKRAFDFVASLVLLVIAAPIIAVCALAVLVTSGAPVFYSATRVGKDGRPFRMWKLRTMVRDADAIVEYWKRRGTQEGVIYLQSYKLRNDPRITPIGRILRKTSLDELPQLFNVLRGDMSLVGPRPYYLSELQEYPDVLESLTQVRPAITGPWQIGGRNEITPRERMAIDQHYVKSFTAVGDIACLLKTAVHLLKADGL